ncbi:MAG: 7-carboxy-7-deazaguanine synthase QueE [Gammaproteobacteria bacterium]|nr:7-carboxy-7-deazaguanine synthase QueE [Gammaproteobacteria bacterium]
MSTLQITEIFYSLQGESNTVGMPTVFVRLTGCPLRCGYCDTEYAFSGGEQKTMPEIMRQVASYGCQRVTVTGGEPLAQKECRRFLTMLCDADYRVSLETCGAMDLSGVDPRVVKVMDIKTPGSGEAEKNLFTNISYLSSADQIKFVICDEADYTWSKQVLDKERLAQRSELIMLPAFGQQDATELAEWILRDRLPVRFQVQLHKQLWGDAKGK